MTIQDHNEAFEKIIAGLNPSQREAVETIEGPVLVIAGPGTGKTHILAARIGKILLETDAQPHNILCLTFTEAGVRSMRQRLIDFIGPEAHRLHVHTFHSFSNKIIRENLEVFGRKELEPISELERIELLQKLIDELPLDHRLRRGRGSDLYFYIPHLIDLFAKMKSEHWSADSVCRKADEYLKDLPLRDEFIYKRNGKGFKKGDLKQSAFDRALEKMEMLKAAAKLFPAFLRKMDQWRRYDYHDMILWTLQAFAKNPNLLRAYQEQYLYFLVDEFQDTNGAQNEILQNLIEYWENPNVFIVGDDDQSIYEFQGARLKNLTDFFDKYREHLKLVVLADNYRSSQNILDTSGALIARNQIRITANLQKLGIDKILTAQNGDFATLKTPPQISEFPYRFHEVAQIVNEIEAMKNADFPLEEIAVIYAKHSQSLDLIELFNKKRIPYNTRKKINLLDLPLVRQIRTILEYLAAENTAPFSGENRLFKILHYPFWATPKGQTHLNDLARLSLFFAKARKEKEYFWKEAMHSPKLMQRAGIEDPSGIVAAAKIIKDLQKSVYGLSVPHLVERVFNKTGLLTWALAQPDKAWQVQVLHSFLDFVKTETARNPRIDLQRLLDIFKSMDDNRISIELQKIAQTEAGVNLLTAHGSKGLEFQRVFILDATGDIWEPKARGRSFTFSLPDTITFSGAEDETEARRRLFYVAMTRAKEQLKISYSRHNNEGKEIQRAIYVDEILQGASLNVDEKQLTQETILEAQTVLLSDAEVVKIESPNPAAIKELLEDFKLSISALNSYLYCPIGFYYENILRVPAVQREAASYGSAMHEALEKFYKKMLSGNPKRFPGIRELLKDFGEEMGYWRGFFTERSFEQRLRAGKHHLKNFHRAHSKNRNKAVKIEYRISNTEIDGVPVVGVIDRVEFLKDQKAHIVDYKTNKPKPEHLRKPTPKKPEGGNYWRQLIFYKLLFENYKNTDNQVVSGEITYLEPDKKGEYLSPQLTFSTKETEQVRKLITETYAKIMAQEFYEGCGKPECNWCNFVRSQQMPGTFSREADEELDDG